ncbi:MAG: LEA type 2 family protein [Steroidobacteraceae bacterium]
MRPSGLGGLLLLGLACLVQAGCASIPLDVRSPELSLVGVEAEDLSVFEQRLLVRLKVFNPNDRVLPVRGIDLEVFLEGERLATGTTERAFEVPARGEAEFDMRVRANAATALLKVLESGRKREGQALRYRIRGEVRTALGLLRKLPFDEQGTLDLDRRRKSDPSGG